MFNSKQQKEIDERYDREVKLIDRKLSGYEERRRLEIDQDIQHRKETNWGIVDDARNDSYDKRVILESNIAKLEAKQEILSKTQVTDNEKLLKERENEIVRLNDIIKQLISKLPVGSTIQVTR